MFLAFHQALDPIGNVLVTTMAALVPVALLLVLLAVFRMTAWLAVLIGSVVTLLLGILVWGAPAGPSLLAYLYGSATGVWSVDWITFWGVVIFNTLVVTGLFEHFKGWLISQATQDVRVQAILLAWAFGALLEGLVGFGYPWAVVAPILVAFGIAELDAIRVAALANNAPVSYGALGAPIIGLAAVTGLPLLALSASIGKIVAVLALAPPWVLIYLVSGWRGVRTGWPLAVVGSLAYIAGQFPISQWVNPYLPDVVGALVCFAALLVLLRFWRPSETLGYGGVAIARRPMVVGGGSTPQPGVRRDVMLGLAPFVILVLVVALWTGPWSPLPKYMPLKLVAGFTSSIGGKAGNVAFNWAPGVAGTSILGVVAADPRAPGGDGAPAPGRGAARGVPAHVPADVGRAAGGGVHLRAGVRLQLLGDGQLDGERLLEDRHRVHPAGGGRGLDRGGAVRQQHVDERPVRRLPEDDRADPGVPGAPAALAELGGRRGRQAGGAADDQRGRGHERLRAQRGRGDPAQHGLDARAARLPDRHRPGLLLLPARHDAVS
jgi:hypothetical protein